MAINKFSLRISGVAALEDETNATFLGLYDSVSGQSIISVDGNTGFRKNYPSKKAEVEDLAIYDDSNFGSGAGAVTPASDPVDAGDVVRSLSMVITGRVAFDDETHQDFVYEVRDTGDVYNALHEGSNNAWAAIAADLSSDAGLAARAVIEGILTQLYSSDSDPIAVTLSS
jgi:hypothetical protein